MWKRVAAVLLLSGFTNFVATLSPSLQKLPSIRQASEELLPEASTHLTPRFAGSGHDPGELVPHRQGPWGLTPEELHISSYPKPGLLLHSPNSPFKRPVREAEGLDSSLHEAYSSKRRSGAQPAFVEEGSSSQTLNRVASSDAVMMPGFAYSRTRGLDAELSLKKSLRDNWMEFPDRAMYVPSEWFNSYLNDLTAHISNYKKRGSWSTTQDASQEEVAASTDRAFRSLLQRSDVYRIKIPSPLVPSYEEGEVLVTFSHSFAPRKGRTLRRQMSVWGTMDGGKAMAFLGLYHLPIRYFDKLVRELKAVRYTTESPPGSLKAYLKPVVGETSNDPI